MYTDGTDDNGNRNKKKTGTTIGKSIPVIYSELPLKEQM